MAVVRKMTLEDIDQVLSWTTEQKWNMTRNDILYFFEVQPEGRFVAEVDGNAVGCCFATKHGEDFGIFGLFIVDHSVRGKGIGSELMKVGHTYLEMSSGKRNLCLSGREDVLPFYRRFGYKISSWNVVGYSGCPDLNKLAEFKIPESITCTDALAEDIMTKVLLFDAKLHPYERKEHIKSRLLEDGAVSRAAISEGGDVIGYGIVSPCEHYGYHLGPLYADTFDAARAIIQDILSAKPEVATKGLFIEAAEPNVNAEAFGKFLNLNAHYKLRKMFTLHDVALPTEKVYSQINTDTHVI